MSVARLNQKNAISKTPLALHLAGQWAGKGKRVTLIDADPQSPALDWPEQRVRRSFDRHFGVIALARDTLRCEALELTHHADHIIIAGPPLVAALLRSAPLAHDLALLPAQPSPFDGSASAERRSLIAEAHGFRAALIARLVLSRCPTRIARETTTDTDGDRS